jgi:RNA polymerase sigma-70 factor (ECF subfamily)
MGAQPHGTPSDRQAAVPGASDAQLLRAIATGSEAAFEELRGRYDHAVARVCRRLAGSEREDCEQEVFARIWRKAALFDPDRGSAAAWLLILARRTALNLQAAHRPLTPIGDELVLGTVEPPEVEAFWLDGALARLTKRERTVIELSYYSDLSESAIASRLRVPLGSVKSWKRRGLNRLATLLGEESP